MSTFSDKTVWRDILEFVGKDKAYLYISKSGREEGELAFKEYQKELENLLGMTYDEMNEDMIMAMKTKLIKVELMNNDAKFPEYAYFRFFWDEI